MKFTEAYEEMKKGKKVRYSSWDDDFYIYLGDTGLILTCEGEPWVGGSLHRESWEVVPDKPRKLWRRPVKFSDSRWMTDLDWWPSKKAFNKAYPRPRFEGMGPWESMDEPEITED